MPPKGQPIHHSCLNAYYSYDLFVDSSLHVMPGSMRSEVVAHTDLASLRDRSLYSEPERFGLGASTRTSLTHSNGL